MIRLGTPSLSLSFVCAGRPEHPVRALPTSGNDILLCGRAVICILCGRLSSELIPSQLREETACDSTVDSQATPYCRVVEAELM